MTKYEKKVILLSMFLFYFGSLLFICLLAFLVKKIQSFWLCELRMVCIVRGCHYCCSHQHTKTWSWLQQTSIGTTIQCFQYVLSLIVILKLLKFLEMLQVEIFSFYFFFPQSIILVKSEYMLVLWSFLNNWNYS